jgi:hypothetical protein
MQYIIILLLVILITFLYFKSKKENMTNHNNIINDNLLDCDDTEINYVCSLGRLCYPASFLKKNKLKLVSYPFDWTFSNFDMIIHAIEDDFKIFLDQSYYVNIDETICDHSYYKDLRFNHHNPLINKKDYNYYKRCVNRFKNLLKYKERKLFIIIFNNLDMIDINIKNNIINFNNRLKKYTNNYILLVIYHLQNKPQNRHTFTYDDNIHFLELHTLSHNGGTSFYNEKDNIYFDNIISHKYNFNLLNIPSMHNELNFDFE